MRHHTSLKLSVIALSLMAVTGCTSTYAARSEVVRSETTQVVRDAAYYENATVDELLAPIALYPDALLSHILIAATYPLEVVQAERWTQDYEHLDADAALTAVESQPWDPSVKALVATPDVLKRMSEDLAWTQALGEAFLAEEEAVLASIQSLRQQAYTAGNLASDEHINVQREEKTIVIETVRREVVYVPYYDSRYVYGDWWWRNRSPVYWHYPSLHVSVGSGIYWGINYHVPSAFYFSSFYWPQRYVVVHHHHYHKPKQRYPERRQIVRDGRRWQHEPEHRRGVKFKRRDLQWDGPKRHVVERRDPAENRTVERRKLSTTPTVTENPGKRLSTRDTRVADDRLRQDVFDITEQPVRTQRPAVRTPEDVRTRLAQKPTITEQPTRARPQVSTPLPKQQPLFKQTPQPRIAEPAVQPRVRNSQPVLRQQPTRPPVVSQPRVSQPRVSQPSYSRPAVSQPRVSQPSYSRPAVSQPAVSQPRVSQPSVQPVQPVSRPAVRSSRPQQDIE
ncbi:DUF3300 domain-containing protein [Pseudidiomarina aestuarii]|uniref:DUF3300 domain-containing protein n=1 Tax=Pseudidiomarina aestuarii TaxID=624146 RepID=UPI003A96B01C